MSDIVKVTGTGDSLFVTDFPKDYLATQKTLADFIGTCNLRMTNLETNLSDFEFFANAYSGGTWINTRRACLKDLAAFGFNYFGTANNHVMDYGIQGLCSTIDTLEAAGFAHSGTGRSLEEAARPAVIDLGGQKAAVFAVDTSFAPPSCAGRASRGIPARPGVNYLRHDTVYPISPEDEAALRSIAEKTGLNFSRNLSIATGFALEDAPGNFTFGKEKFTTETDKPVTRCNEKDLARIAKAISDAKRSCSLVFLLVHCHDDDNRNHSNPPEYLKEFVHACIDAGASGIFGGGCHSLRGVEMYHGQPIFYSLGDFIYQGLVVEQLPADFKEKYSVSPDVTAAEALNARSKGGKVGLHCHKKNYQTFLPRLSYADGKLQKLELLPVYLNFDRKDEWNGLPQIASEAEAAEILKLLNELSAPFGTQFHAENGLFLLD